MQCVFREIIHMITPPKWNCLGKGQDFALLESYAKIDVHHLGGALVDENVTQMSVTKAQNVTCNRRGSDATRVCKGPLYPGLG